MHGLCVAGLCSTTTYRLSFSRVGRVSAAMPSVQCTVVRNTTVYRILHEVVIQYIVPDTLSVNTKDDRQTRAFNKTLSIALITGADTTRYGTLIAHLSNQYASGRDEYPDDATGACNLLVSYYRTPENTARPRHVPQYAPRNPPGLESETDSAMTFTQHGSVTGNNGLTHEGIECYPCHSLGHYASNCPTMAAAFVGTTLTQYAFMMAQANVSNIDPGWILLDSQSTISVFNNASMLTDIRKSNHTLRALTNGGHQDSDMIGNFHNLGTVW